MTHLRIKHLLKTNRWWDYQLPVMLAGVYCSLTFAPNLPTVWMTISTMLIFFVASIGIGGFGHLVNDLFDVDQDLASGAESLIADRQTFKVVRKFIVVILLAWLPWFWLPTNPMILSLLTMEFLLCICYSMPPIRLKDRGAFGLIADSLYSYTISNAVALLVFAKLAYIKLPSWFAGLWIFWSFTVGLRQILGHQIEDLSRDRIAGIRTFVTIHGWNQSVEILEKLLFPVELCSFIVLLLLLSTYSQFIAPGLFLYTVFLILKQNLTGIHPVFRLLRTEFVERLFFINNRLLHRFYTHWMPFLALIPLVIKMPSYLALVILHFVLFQNGPKCLILSELPEYRRLRRAS